MVAHAIGYQCGKKPFQHLCPGLFVMFVLDVIHRKRTEFAGEMAEFEKNPNLKEIVKVRYYDDAGKRANLETKTFSHYAPMVQRIVDTHCGEPNG